MIQVTYHLHRVGETLSVGLSYNQCIANFISWQAALIIIAMWNNHVWAYTIDSVKEVSEGELHSDNMHYAHLIR
jgi:hypothetical protein